MLRTLLAKKVTFEIGMILKSPGFIHMLEQGTVGDASNNFAAGLDNIQRLSIHLSADKNKGKHHSDYHTNDHQASDNGV